MELQREPKNLTEQAKQERHRKKSQNCRHMTTTDGYN